MTFYKNYGRVIKNIIREMGKKKEERLFKIRK